MGRGQDEGSGPLGAGREAEEMIKERLWKGYPLLGEAGNTYDSLMACDLPTAWLQRIALQCYTHDNGRPMWHDIATTEADARDYFYGELTEANGYSADHIRSEAALVLGAYGWTPAMICQVYS